MLLDEKSIFPLERPVRDAMMVGQAIVSWIIERDALMRGDVGGGKRNSGEAGVGDSRGMVDGNVITSRDEDNTEIWRDWSEGDGEVMMSILEKVNRAHMSPSFFLFVPALPFDHRDFQHSSLTGDIR
jgi:hypothetical protein